MDIDRYIEQGARMLDAVGRDSDRIASITCAIADILYAAHANGLNVQQIMRGVNIHAKHIGGEG